MNFPRATGTPYEQWAPRSARIYIPARKPWATYGVLSVTLVVFLLQQASRIFLGRDWVALFLLKIPAAYIVASQQWWRLWTPILVHAGVLHLAFNMYALYWYGPWVERLIGSGWFLLAYLTAGLWGNALSAILSRYPSVGASSALFGIFAVLLWLLKRHQHLLGLWGQNFSRQMLGLIVINLLWGVWVPSVDNWGHIGGALGGWLFTLLAGPQWDLRPYPFEALTQHEKAALFLKRIMPLQLYNRRSLLRRWVALLLLWSVPVVMVWLVGRIQG